MDISRVLPLDDVREAHVDMEERRTTGRIVLAVDDDPAATMQAVLS